MLRRAARERRISASVDVGAKLLLCSWVETHPRQGTGALMKLRRPPRRGSFRRWPVGASPAGSSMLYPSSLARGWTRSSDEAHLRSGREGEAASCDGFVTPCSFAPCLLERVLTSPIPPTQASPRTRSPKSFDALPRLPRWRDFWRLLRASPNSRSFFLPHFLAPADSLSRSKSSSVAHKPNRSARTARS